MPAFEPTANRSPFTGIIEGFFGRTWSWSDRHAMVDFLAREGFDFYLYAPKADPHLRRQWTAPWPASEWQALLALREHCRDKGIDFGVGLSPLDLYREPPAQARQQLHARVRQLNALEPDLMGLLFDDMRGDLPALARRQVELAHVAAEISTARRLVLCPTYYSDDPVLEKVFGERPTHYWEDLGAALDHTIDVFWTGPQVCSPTYPAEHLERVSERLQRRPFLWDNYPVNDGAKLCGHLRLSPYPASHGQLPGQVAGHAVNPMNQALLSQIPLATLPLAYRLGVRYREDAAWQEALERCCSTPLAAALQADVEQLQHRGLPDLSREEIAALRKRYVALSETLPDARETSSAMIQELIDWLDGGYTFDPACLTD
ncbi:beta-N-acetylglucosaminidase domain-containing protein [Marinimicrobium sp. ARAG 43.8]|uniref:beta-N-acetylglucosaminidase domain-containing protein n=1 Tax=Marinimicrobium sp. ARAG 43.8 TaxID=3418719 RepID=UPI003CEAF37D